MMDKNTKIVLAIAALALVIGLGDLWAVTRPIKVITQEGKPAIGERFGGTTGLDSLSLAGNLTVTGNSTFTGTTAQTGNATFAGNVSVTGDTTLSGASTMTGTSTFNGTTVGIGRTQTISMSTATNTVCAIRNTSGATRILTGAFANFTATSSVGSVGVFAAGTSTGPTVTSTNPFISTALTKSATLDVINSTSTFNSTSTNNPNYPLNYLTWRNLEWITFNIGATSVSDGTCYIKYD